MSQPPGSPHSAHPDDPMGSWPALDEPAVATAAVEELQLAYRDKDLCGQWRLTHVLTSSKCDPEALSDPGVRREFHLARSMGAQWSGAIDRAYAEIQAAWAACGLAEDEEAYSFRLYLRSMELELVSNYQIQSLMSNPIAQLERWDALMDAPNPQETLQKFFAEIRQMPIGPDRTPLSHLPDAGSADVSPVAAARLSGAALNALAASLRMSPRLSQGEIRELMGYVNRFDPADPSAHEELMHNAQIRLESDMSQEEVLRELLPYAVFCGVECSLPWGVAPIGMEPVPESAADGRPDWAQLRQLAARDFECDSPRQQAVKRYDIADACASLALLAGLNPEPFWKAVILSTIEQRSPLVGLSALTLWVPTIQRRWEEMTAQEQAEAQDFLVHALLALEEAPAGPRSVVAGEQAIKLLTTPRADQEQGETTEREIERLCQVAVTVARWHREIGDPASGLLTLVNLYRHATNHHRPELVARIQEELATGYLNNDPASALISLPLWVHPRTIRPEAELGPLAGLHKLFPESVQPSLWWLPARWEDPNSRELPRNPHIYAAVEALQLAATVTPEMLSQHAGEVSESEILAAPAIIADYYANTGAPIDDLAAQTLRPLCELLITAELYEDVALMAVQLYALAKIASLGAKIAELVLLCLDQTPDLRNALHRVANSRLMGFLLEHYSPEEVMALVFGTRDCFIRHTMYHASSPVPTLLPPGIRPPWLHPGVWPGAEEPSMEANPQGSVWQVSRGSLLASLTVPAGPNSAEMGLAPGEDSRQWDMQWWAIALFLLLR